MNTTTLKKILSCFCLIAFVIFFLTFALQKDNKPSISQNAVKLNTFISISIYDSTDYDLIANCFELCDKYEKIFSRTDPDSELFKLNNGLLADSDGKHYISDELATVIQAGLTISKLSNGAFSIALAPLLDSLIEFSEEEFMFMFTTITPPGLRCFATSSKNSVDDI